MLTNLPLDYVKKLQRKPELSWLNGSSDEGRLNLNIFPI
jgi:hypothetical protein